MAEVQRMVCASARTMVVTLQYTLLYIRHKISRYPTMRRNTIISICKAIGIILMVIGHTEGTGWLGSFIYEFHMPLFFITAGYFFSLKYLDDEATFVKKRFRTLYLPFLKWSVFFLAIHNWMFSLGILNDQYGNAAGGVTHPYSWHQMQQNLWTMVSAMGGYDQFLCGAFWFFRGLLIASISYLVLFKLFDGMSRMWRISERYDEDCRETVIPVAICLTTLLLATWKTGEGLKVTNLIQGGYREIMGTFFFGCGFLFRQFEHIYRPKWWSTVVFCAVVFAFSRLAPTSMSWNAKLNDFIALPVPAICGFLMTYNISTWLDRHEGLLKRFLVYCGDNTMCIFVFHIVSFKVVSLIKIWYYGLDPKQIGCHMVIHEHANDDCFWIVYSIAGVCIPLAWTYAYRRITAHIKSSIS